MHIENAIVSVHFSHLQCGTNAFNLVHVFHTCTLLSCSLLFILRLHTYGVEEALECKGLARGITHVHSASLLLRGYYIINPFFTMGTFGKVPGMPWTSNNESWIATVKSRKHQIINIAINFR